MLPPAIKGLRVFFQVIWVFQESFPLDKQRYCSKDIFHFQSNWNFFSKPKIFQWMQLSQEYLQTNILFLHFYCNSIGVTTFIWTKSFWNIVKYGITTTGNHWEPLSHSMFTWAMFWVLRVTNLFQEALVTQFLGKCFLAVHLFFIKRYLRDRLRDGIIPGQFVRWLYWKVFGRLW